LPTSILTQRTFPSCFPSSFCLGLMGLSILP
jgi:hypothetical protein